MRKLGVKGQSMVELLVILQAMLLLIMGAIQFALIYHAKITLNYAAYEAVRAGSLNNADYEAIQEGFARGLAPLYSYATDDDEQIDAYQDARDKILEEFDSSDQLIRIERLSPQSNDFTDFALSDGNIPNDNLRYRTSDTGLTGHRNIQDANLLHLRITYWYPLYVPMVDSVIYSAICELSKWSDDTVCSGDDKKIPLTAVAAMRMQSPAMDSSGFY